MDMEEARSRLFMLCGKRERAAKNEREIYFGQREECAKDVEALGIAIGLMGTTKVHPKAAYCSAEGKQYGYALPYDKNDMDTLGQALGLLWTMIANTTKAHGAPKGLEWVVIDWQERGPILPEINDQPMPPGYTCTVGFKAYFDGKMVEWRKRDDLPKEVMDALLKPEAKPTADKATDEQGYYQSIADGLAQALYCIDQLDDRAIVFRDTLNNLRRYCEAKAKP